MIPKRNCYFFCKNLFLICFTLAVVIYFITFVGQYFSSNSNVGIFNLNQDSINRTETYKKETPHTEIADRLLAEGVGKDASTIDKVHVFYYPWYGNPEDDTDYLHWNHEYLPNWDKQDSHVYPSGRHHPPDDIGANFYPLLGCYSSKNVETVDQHMKWIKEAGIGVLIISWYPPELSDKEGKPFDQLFPMFLETASVYNLKIAFHIEPYAGRTPESFRKNVEYIVQKYGDHPSVYKLARHPLRKPLPVFYVYDSYLNSPVSWSSILNIGGKQSIRNTNLDGIFLGLVVELRHK